MTVTRHPATGVLLNDIEILRTGPVTPEEEETAYLLQRDGIPRWQVAAQLGRHPLAFGSVAKPLPPARRPKGNDLSRAAARTDPRQSDLITLIEARGDEAEEH